MIQQLNEEETRFFKENGPVRIPFGGRVRIGTGLYRDKEGAMVAGAMDLGWMENAEKIGSWLDEGKRNESVHLARMVFPDIKSIDTMVSQLVILERFMLKETGSVDPMGEVWEHLKKVHQTVSERIEDVEKETQEEND